MSQPWINRENGTLAVPNTNYSTYHSSGKGCLLQEEATVDPMPSTHQSRRLQSLAEPCVTAVTLGTCFYEARLCPVQWRPFHIHRLTSGCFFSFYFSIPGVLCGKEGTDKGSMSGVHLKTPHKTRICIHLQVAVYGFSISWASFYPLLPCWSTFCRLKQAPQQLSCALWNHNPLPVALQSIYSHHQST